MHRKYDFQFIPVDIDDLDDERRHTEKLDYCAHKSVRIVVQVIGFTCLIAIEMYTNKLHEEMPI